jgi:hypothetical protein
LVVQKKTFDIKKCDKTGRQSNEMTPCAVDNEVELTHDPKKTPSWVVVSYHYVEIMKLVTK